MSVVTPTLIQRPPRFPRLLPHPPQTHPLPYEGQRDGQDGNYGHLNARRDLQREMDDLSEEESELEDLSLAIQQRGFPFLVPIGKNLTTLEEKNDAEEEESDSDDSASAQSGGPPSVMEDEGENDLDASMEDLDEDGQNSDDADEMEEGDTEELEEGPSF